MWVIQCFKTLQYTFIKGSKSYISEIRNVIGWGTIGQRGMGDIHVHTAPHDYEEGGYDVWYWGDMTSALLFVGLACVEGAVANAMHRRKRELGGWQDVRGGQLWWGRKFMFLCALAPVTLLRAGNLWVWAEFNGEAETGEMRSAPSPASHPPSRGPCIL